MRKAFTLFELIAVVIVFAILSAVVMWGVRGCTSQGPGAEDSMRDYVGKLYPGQALGGVACTNQDTDGDGYVSCSATVNSGMGLMQINADCATKGFMTRNSGCKPVFTLKQ